MGQSRIPVLPIEVTHQHSLMSDIRAMPLFGPSCLLSTELRQYNHTWVAPTNRTAPKRCHSAQKTEQHLKRCHSTELGLTSSTQYLRQTDVRSQVVNNLWVHDIYASLCPQRFARPHQATIESRTDLPYALIPWEWEDRAGLSRYYPQDREHKLSTKV